MSKQGRVLIIDDLEKWCEELVETLKNGGFYAEAASTVEQALQKVEADFYHLLIVDIRMDEDDQANEGGILLLQTLKNRNLLDDTKIIILSVYGTKPLMRTAFRDVGVVDFLEKDDFDNQEFLKGIHRLFAEKIKLNLDLNIHWQQGSAMQAVSRLESVRNNASIKQYTALELEDLLCRLFHTAHSILVYPMTSGFSGTGILRIQPMYTNGGGNKVVIKFGDPQQIENEYRNFEEHVRPFIGGNRSTAIYNKARTMHLGGIIYSLLGASGEQVDFGTFYHHATIEEIKQTLDLLFHDTCRAWYANPGRQQVLNLSKDYPVKLGFTLEKLEQSLLNHLKSVRGTHRLIFKSLKSEHEFTNPIIAAATASLIYPTYICNTHGDFNQNNIMIDSTGNSWLIDFQQTEPGHILRDVAMLDTEIRIKMLSSEDATLEERWQMEEALCNIERFNQLDQLATVMPKGNKALEKAYHTVIYLRQIASKLVPQHQNHEMSEYYASLLYTALNTTRFSDLPTGQREHALLSASLLADRLELKV
jgi:CheY-like chemotaxis protein